VNGTAASEGVKRERKGDVIRNVDKDAIDSPLHDDASNVAPSRYRPVIECGGLPRFPCEK